jgi:hypothetical protein
VPYTPPIPSSFTTAVAPIVLPDDLSAVTVTVGSGGGAWIYQAWTEIVAANVLTSHALGYLYLLTGSGSAAAFQLRVGTGASGSEVGIGEWRGSFSSTGVIPVKLFVFPLIIVPANARVAVQGACGAASAFTLEVKLGFYPTPL